MADTTLARKLAALSPAQRASLLSQRLRDRAPGSGIPALGRPLSKLPASPGQRRLWLLAQASEVSAAYHVPVTLRLEGAIDPVVLASALADLVERHEPLRTRFEFLEGELYQCVGAPETPELVKINLSSLPQAAALSAGLRKLRAVAAEPFDLGRDIPIRPALVRIGAEVYLLGLCFHHIAVDAVSVDVLIGDLGKLYAAKIAGREPTLAPLRIQYADLATWQNDRHTGAAGQALTEFWSNTLAGSPPLARPPLSQHGAGSAMSGTLSRHEFCLNETVTEGIRRLSRAHRATPFMILLTGYLMTLSAAGAGRDLTVGTPVAGRTEPGTEDMVGFLIETLVLRTVLPAGGTVAELIDVVRQNCLDAYAHQGMPFDHLIERLRPPRVPGVNPLFQTYFAMRPASGQDEFAGMKVQRLGLGGSEEAKFDLALYVLDAGGQLPLWLDFRADRYDGTFAEVFAAALLRAFTLMLEDPARAVDDLLDELDIAALEPAVTQAPGTATVHVTPAVSMALDAHQPRDRWEHCVTRTWAEVLGLPGVSLHDDFFDIGGHSMAAMLMADRLFRLTGHKVPLSMLFAPHTAAQLATALRQATTDGQAVLSVELAPGSGRPVFFLPSVTGELYMYLDVVRRLRLVRPCIGLQTADGTTMEEIAAGYASEIRRRQTEGPYDLCGFSAAGIFAFAVAEHLTRAGCQVGELILIDSHPTLYQAGDVDESFVLSWYLPYAPAADELRLLPRSERLGLVLAKGKESGDLSADTTVEDLDRLSGQLERHAHALGGYRPAGYPGIVTLLTRQESPVDLAALWRTHAHRLEVQTVAVGEHLALLRECAELTANALAGRFDAKERQP